MRGFTDRFNHDGEYTLIGRQGALCGNVNFAVGKSYFTEHAIAVRADKKNQTRFLYYLFSTMDLGQYSGQSAQPGLAVGNLVELKSTLPDKQEQEKISGVLTALDTLITLHQRKLEKLVQIRKAFAERCFLQSRKEFVMAFTKEADFEEAVVKLLIERGWKDGVLKNYTEQQLIQNWANILFENNRGIDRLNDYPLTDGEMQQIMEQVMNAKTPMKLNKFINGKSVLIKRDNPDDKLNFGKEVSLKIYDRLEIAAGLSRYQIAEQPKFPTKSKILNDRRGDLMLLINGMPVIHMELKKSGVSIKRACSQIEKYAAEGIFTGLFSLVQIFVAMNPEETVYFANPGPEGQFNPSYYFHWADFYNEPMNDWKDVTTALLSIPMAHMLVGFYTVADGSDGILKVMRSYQYYAASKISDAVSKAKWENDQQRGGYIWHTTGSGKTMTSFKSAQLIASSKDADKVIFLMDRIELGTQSLKEYRNFAGENEEVQATENTDVLVDKLKSTSPSDTLIVTSIQKMSNIKDDAQNKLNPNDIALINAKRLVFIVDECHRSTFGDMMQTIKHTFPKALFFGFTGTPIQGENQKKMSTTAALCFPSRTLPSPSFLLIFFLPVPSPINPFSPAHCTASPKTAPRTVCRSVGSLPAVAHVPGLCSMRSVRLDESCSEWLSSSSDIVLTVAHILPSVQPPACPPAHRSGPAHPAECDKLSYYG